VRSREKYHRGSISASTAAWCSELNFTHDKRFPRVDRRPEICRPEWEEAVGQRKALGKFPSIVRTTSAMPGSSKLGPNSMLVLA